jgi:deoxyribodipyrimidine photo-lyase
MKINIFWYRRDLRTEDNPGLFHAIKSELQVLPVFILDTNITEELSDDDTRINFIYERLLIIDQELKEAGGSLCIFRGDPIEIFKRLMILFEVNAVFANKDYEPYSRQRDMEIEALLKKHNARFFSFKDHVIFEESEILKPDGNPYSVFTPYKKIWIRKLVKNPIHGAAGKLDFKGRFLQHGFSFPSIRELGLRISDVSVRPFDLSVIPEYDKYRDIPSADRTSYLSPHLRFGTVSIRKIVNIAINENQVFLNELIWREFFMQILFHFPYVVTENFKQVYDGIQWRNNENEFRKWCNGETGYPLVDAGMRQLNLTGYMHGRVRMVTAGFLVRHLLIDWRWGEAYFARKLLDYELSSNNGNWQWAAGTGCDAVPYFRIFNPEIQRKKFDREDKYVKSWVEDLEKPGYAPRIVEHEFARHRAIATFKKGIRIRYDKSGSGEIF